MILSLGCSHSAGPYDLKDNKILSKDNWPQAVSKHTQEKYRHVALPGQGILSYYEVLKYLDEQQQLIHINKLLIQHTQEPRLISSIKPSNIIDSIVEEAVNAVSDDGLNFKHTIIDNKGLILNIGSPNTLFDSIFHGNLTKDKPNSETKLFITELFDNLHSLFSYARFYKNIFDLTRAEIVRICERNNIKLFEFAWDWSASHTNDMTWHYEKVHTISSSDYMIVKEEFMKSIANDLNTDYHRNEDSLRKLFDSYTNKIGHFGEQGEAIAHKVIIDYLKSVEFFNV